MNPAFPLLLVEGNRTDRLLLHKALSKCGYALDAVICASAEEALHYLETAPLPSMVIASVALPDMDSEAFLQRLDLHPQWRSLPVVLWGRRSELQSHSGHRQLLTGLSLPVIEKGETLGEYISGLSELVNECMPQRLSA
ncbi:hypothetical protein GCM10008955_08740 [Deinococcus malanensis]|uniref:Response regulatory domain-containing protein n=1 Tax=Deinococcus malanensis TaxID=1706855 RepID=A0ABQ2EN76_9DEIO|nr:response regulator [Deinococcus malanensis]GGK17470.1 hypothetical protein GCM10008955_08740 [Deinococcus malanensis]